MKAIWVWKRDCREVCLNIRTTMKKERSNTKGRNGKQKNDVSLKGADEEKRKKQRWNFQSEDKNKNYDNNKKNKNIRRMLKKGLFGEQKRKRSLKVQWNGFFASLIKKPKEQEPKPNKTPRKEGFKNTFLHAETRPTIVANFSFFLQLTAYSQQKLCLPKTLQE